ncbi:MAG: hypothetical protein ACXAC8_11620 [Candidatus Hodarchaeales archaeon]|jgi:ADP-ribose pyrophosphatase YjhB (NUDIX family)
MATKIIHKADGLLIDTEIKIVYIKRKSEAFHSFWAISGGIVEEEEKEKKKPSMKP